MRINKVITKRGDKGKTSLGDGTEVSKNHPRIQALGNIDELNSLIGTAIVVCPDKELKKELITLQNDLFNLGGEVSIPNFDKQLLNEERVYHLEERVEKMNETLPALKEFVLPGGNEFSSRIHVARAVCRRAESKIIPLLEEDGNAHKWIQYLNRLSDYLFVLARYYSHSSEKLWETHEK